MHILLTNDDGIEAIGIQSLRMELERVGRVSVVAPDRERSASGHGITVHKPLRVETVSFSGGKVGWAVSGTPADCVKLALEGLLVGQRPDLVVSGINRGANLGTDVLYSGTVSAAIEGMMAGIPSVAVSLTGEDHLDFSFAARFTAKVCAKLYREGLAKDTLLNINVPDLPANEIRGVQVTRLGTRRYDNAVHKRKDPRGKVYYWLAGEVVDVNREPGTDLAAIAEQAISVTPIHFDLTDYRILEEVRSWDLNRER